MNLNYYTDTFEPIQWDIKQDTFELTSYGQYKLNTYPDDHPTQDTLICNSDLRIKYWLEKIYNSIRWDELGDFVEYSMRFNKYQIFKEFYNMLSGGIIEGSIESIAAYCLTNGFRLDKDDLEELGDDFDNIDFYDYITSFRYTNTFDVTIRYR